jgi:thioredoxin-like negative regulator of GroEL
MAAREVATSFGIKGVPNVRYFLDGQEVETFTGPRTVEGLSEFIEARQ